MPDLQRTDPLPAFRFRVEMEGTPIPEITEVTGLVFESGLPISVGPGVTPPTVTLKRGVTDHTGFWDWVRDTRKNPSLRRDLQVILMDAEGNDVVAWNLQNAYPVRWHGPDLAADMSLVALETLEVGYDNLVWIKMNGTPV